MTDTLMAGTLMAGTLMTGTPQHKKHSSGFGHQNAYRSGKFLGLLRASCAVLVGVVCVGVLAAMTSPAQAQLDVWVRFGTSWENELADLAADAGITPFSLGEISTLKTGILSELNRIYDDYNITFDPAATDPGGSRDVINFGATTSSDFTLGQAPLFPFLSLRHSALSPTTAAKVFVQNFDFIVNEFSGSTSRATQLAQLTNAIAGTGAHELLHSLGAPHRYAYGNEGITQSNYASTGGLQNTAIIATGSTGLNEVGRETQRELGRWERAHLDMSGGSIKGGTSVVTSPVTTLNENTEFGSSTDFGPSAATATAIQFTPGETSGLLLSLIYGDFDSSNDKDWLSITLPSEGYLTLEILSEGFFGRSIDSYLTLVDTDGITELLAIDDTKYSNNRIGDSGIYGTTDVFVPNYLLNAGTYYVEISAYGSGNTGGKYQFAAGFQAIPEPASLLLASFAIVGLLTHQRR